MKVINCPNCNKKLGEINEEDSSLILEKDVDVSGMNQSMGMVIIPFICPHCDKTYVEII